MRLLRPHSAWFGIVLSFYAFIAIGIAEGGLGVLLPSILKTYHLTPATVTLLFLSQVGGYILAALASSIISSRIGLEQTLLLAAIALTSALIIYALTTHWTVMVASGTFLGLGIGLIDAGINTFVASDRRNANLMGFLHGFYGIGALLGPAIATTLLAFGVGWRLVYLVFAAIASILIIGMFWAVTSRYKPMIVRRGSASQTNSKANFLYGMTTPAVLVSGLLLLVYVGTEASLGNWAYTVQSMSRGTPESIAGYSIAAYWMGLTLGRFSLGQVVKYLGAVRTMNFSLWLLLAGLTIWWLLPNQLWSLPLIGFALAAIFPTTVWLMPYRIPDGTVPAAIGFLTSAGSVGAVIIPTILGWIAERASLAIIPALMVPLAALMLILQFWLVNNAPIKKVKS